MKKIISIVGVLLMSVALLNAQTVSDNDKAALEQLNRRVIEASNAGRFDDAADLARQTLERTIKLFGNNSEDTAIAYFNLGEIYRAKKDYKKSIENLEKALEIYRQDEEKYRARIARTAQGLGISYGNERNEVKAEQYLLMALSAAKQAFGKEDKATLPFIINLRNFYIFSGNADKADDKFIEQYLIAAKIFKKDSEELEQIVDEHYCFVFSNFSLDTAHRRVKRFKDAISQTEKSSDDFSHDEKSDDTNSVGASADRKSDDGGASNIVNSKAVRLVRPSYPSGARADRASGMITVKVKIDETGKVIEAKTFCGHPDLRKASEKAARDSKFTPTLVDGKPTQVTGYILYNFVP
jgi:TonB family protein